MFVHPWSWSACYCTKSFMQGLLVNPSSAKLKTWNSNYTLKNWHKKKALGKVFLKKKFLKTFSYLYPQFIRQRAKSFLLGMNELCLPRFQKVFRVWDWRNNEDKLRLKLVLDEMYVIRFRGRAGSGHIECNEHESFELCYLQKHITSVSENTIQES